MVLPPYPTDRATTIDYPRLPVPTNGAVAGTLTFAPVTVTKFALSMMTIGSDNAKITTMAGRRCFTYWHRCANCHSSLTLVRLRPGLPVTGQMKRVTSTLQKHLSQR
jgi:hypothetical protein